MLLKVLPRKAGAAVPHILRQLAQLPYGENGDTTVLRGDPGMTAALIDTLPFLHRYAHGIFYFTAAEHRRMTHDMRDAIIDSFEAHLYAGLARCQYTICWVLRENPDAEEWHFVAPKVELDSGRSLNPLPPGWPRYVEPWRETTIQDFGLDDARDPLREQSLCAWQHYGAPEPAPKTLLRQAVHEAVTKGVHEGGIHSRGDVVRIVGELGLAVVRVGKRSITVPDPANSVGPVTLRGTFYAEAFQIDGSLDRDRALRSQEHQAQAAARYADARDAMARAREARAQLHRQRYPRRSASPSPD